MIDEKLLQQIEREAAEAERKKRPQYVTRTMVMPDGTRKYYRGKTGYEAEKKLREGEAMVRAGIDPGGGEKFGAFVQSWYDLYKKPYLRTSSLTILKYVLNDYILPRFGDEHPRDITPMMIQELMGDLADRGESLQSKVLICLRSIFKVAEENGLVEKSPVSSMLKAGGKKTEEKVALTPEQSRVLLERIGNTRAKTFAMIALNTGMRRGEICGLMWENIDFENHVIHVCKNAVLTQYETEISDNLKTRAGRRDIPLTKDLEEWLLQQKKMSKSQFVIAMRDNKPMTKSAFKSMFKLISRELPEAHVTAHILRHTYITRLFESGLDIKEIQYLAGHSSIDMTLRVYTHYDRASRQAETFSKVRSSFVNPGER